MQVKNKLFYEKGGEGEDLGSESKNQNKERGGYTKPKENARPKWTGVLGVRFWGRKS